MTKSEFIDNLLKNKQMEIMYAYHKQFSKSILTPSQFNMKFQFFQSILVGESIFQEPLIDFSGVYNKILKYYKDKFEIGMLFDKEGKFVKYVF